LIGLWPIFSKKGKALHNKTGKMYLRTLSVVLLTALFGAIFFEFRPFLFLLTVLVFYTAFVGYGTLKLKEKRPTLIDNVVYLTGFIIVLAYFLFFDLETATMNKPVVFSTAGVLLLHVIYDIGKNFYSTSWLKKTWLNDHIIRVVSSFGGLVSAGAGVYVLDESLQPYSQLLPSFFGFVIMGYFLIKLRHYLKPISK
jgi:hypothetical protein